MNIIEHNDSQFTKERNELERYLMRIIQRYFDIEQNHSLESTEAIIVESLMRLKQTLIDNYKFIFNLNGESGNVTLTINKIGGEPAFKKNTAFNKNFGQEEDTVCEGNDERLFDERDPLPHVHKIENIESLKEIIETLEVSPISEIHANQNILDMIRYSGKKAEIDLAELEFLEVAVNRYYENLEYLQREAESIHRKKTEEFVEYKDRILEYLNRAKIVIQTSITWLNKAKEYTNSQTKSTRIWYQSLINKFVTKQQLENMEKYFSNAVQFITDGEITLHDGSIVLHQDMNAEKTIINQHTYESAQIPTEVIENTENVRIKMWFCHDKTDGITERFPLPYMFLTENDSWNVIRGTYDENGHIDINVNLTFSIDGLITNNNFHDDRTIIVPIEKKEVWWTEAITEITNNYGTLCNITKDNKKAFVLNLLNNDIKYWANDKDDMTTSEGSQFLLIDKNGNIEKTEFGRGGYIIEYKIKYLSEYFTNPRIYYQVYGERNS